MKKILVLCICIAILAIIFVFSGKGQYTKALQNLKVDDLDKIVIYNGFQCFFYMLFREKISHTCFKCKELT